MQKQITLTTGQRDIVLKAMVAGTGRTLPAVIASEVRLRFADAAFHTTPPRFTVVMRESLWQSVAAELQGHLNAGTTDGELGASYWQVTELREDLLTVGVGVGLDRDLVIARLG